MRATVGVDVADIKFVVRVDADGRVAAACADGDGAVNPGQAVVGRDRDALAAARAGSARRVRDVDRAVGADLHVAVDAAVALRRREDVDARPEGQAAVVAARTLRAADDVLRAVVERVRVERVRRRRRDGGLVVRPAAEGLVVGACRKTAALHRRPALPVVVGVSRGAVSLPADKFELKDPPRLMIDPADRVNQPGLLDVDGRDVFPRRGRRGRAVVEAHARFERRAGERIPVRAQEGDAAGVDLVVLELRRVRIPVNPDGRLAGGVAEIGRRVVVGKARASSGVERRRGGDVHEAHLPCDALAEGKERDDAQRVSSVRRRRRRYQADVRHDVSRVAERLRDELARSRRAVEDVKVELRLADHRPRQLDADVLRLRRGVAHVHVESIFVAGKRGVANGRAVRLRGRVRNEVGAALEGQRAAAVGQGVAARRRGRRRRRRRRQLRRKRDGTRPVRNRNEEHGGGKT